MKKSDFRPLLGLGILLVCLLIPIGLLIVQSQYLAQVQVTEPSDGQDLDKTIGTIQIIAHVFSFAGCILMVAIGLIKKKKHMLMAQCGQFGLQAVANLLFKSGGGCVAGVVGIVRIFVFERVKRVTVWLKLGFIALQAVMTWVMWQTGDGDPMTWLPLFAMIPYTWYLDTKDPIVFKIVNLYGLLVWLVHDIHFVNIIAVVFDVMTTVSTIVGILLLMRDKIKMRKEQNEVRE